MKRRKFDGLKTGNQLEYTSRCVQCKWAKKWPLQQQQQKERHRQTEKFLLEEEKSVVLLWFGRIVSRIRWIFNSFIFVCGGRTFLLVIVGWKMSSVRVRRFWSVNEATANESNNINRTHSMKMTFRCNTRVEHSTFVVCCWFDVPALHSKCIVY